MATVYSLICFGGRDGKTATMTIASPCVVTLTNHGLRDGTGVVFTTTGALPTGVVSGTTYYARSTAANTFNLYDTAAHAIAGGATGRVTTTGSQSGVHTIKGAYRNALTTDQKARYGSAGSERIYDGIQSWNTARAAAASAFDFEVAEIGDAFIEYVPYAGYPSGNSAQFGFPCAGILITTRVDGVRSSAFHAGVYGTGFLLSSGYDGIRTLYYNMEFNGFQLVTAGGWGVYSACHLGTVFDQMWIKGPNSGIGITPNTGMTFKNCVISNYATGIRAAPYLNYFFVANNLVTGCTNGIKGDAGYEASTNGFWYNNISLGNTTNWGTAILAEGASKNAGLSGEAWIKGTGTRITVATTDFVNFAGLNYKPLASTSPQVEAGVAYYGSVTYDMADAVRPSYIDGVTDAIDTGPFEFDQGNGLAPETLLTITGLLAGSTVRIFASSTQTEQASTTSSGTSYAPTGLTGTVDYTIYKDGYLPIRVTGIALVSGSPQSASGAQTTDRAFVASSGLTYGTTATVNTGTLRFAITAATTGQNWYSFWIEQYRSHVDLRNKPFPLQANGPNSFSLGLGYEFDAAPSIAYLSRDGMRYVDTGGTQTAVWAAILTAGVSSGMRVRYQQSDGGTTGSAVITSGNMDELVQIYGDASHGNFDKRGYLVLKVQEAGYDEAYIDVVGQYGTLEDQLYVVALNPLANGVATGNPALANPPTITDHGASPATWHSKAFSLTITDSAAGNTGTDIMRWLRYYFETGGTFQSKDAFNWHDLVQVNGSDFKTVRGIIYGDTGATLKGVRVVMNDGTTDHPDVTLYTADDGTTYATPVVAVADATVLADTRVQLYNVTQATEIENVFSTGTAYSYTITTEADVGDTLRLRACKKGRIAGEAFAVWGAAGVTFLVSQPEDTIYTTWGIDGATVSEYSLDGPNLQIDANDVDGATQKTRLGAFYSYALTTEVGIRNFYGALSFLSSAAIRVNVDIANLYVENTNAATALYFTDLSVRLYKSDGTSIIAATSYSIHNDYSGVPDVVETGVSGLTGGESAQLMALPSSTANATAILAAAVDGATTLAESIRLHNAVLAGKVSGAGTGTEVFRDLADTKARITATVDASGNRTAITRDAA